MSRLNDMEEMLHSICDEELKEFMREAYLTYMAGAYKSTIIISTIAVYDDLRKKTKILAQINGDAKEVIKEVEKRISKNEVYETFIEDQLLSKNILNPIDKRNLGILKDRRNLSAHPTGYKATAEEARCVYSIAINNFLSKPTLFSNEKVYFIIDSLKNDNYFPTKYIENIAFIVKDETENLHVSSYPMLIRLLVKNSDFQNQNNYILFLLGLVFNSKENEILEKNLAKYFIKTIASNLKAEVAIIKSLIHNENLYNIVNDVTKQRIKFFFNKIIDDDFGNYNQLVSFFELISKRNGKEFITKEFNNEIEKLLNLDVFYIIFAKLANFVCVNDLLKNKYIEKLIDIAKSSSFAEANSFAKKIIEIDEILATNIDEINCFKIILATISGASWGAFDAIDLRNKMYNDIPKIKSKVKNWIINNNEIAFNLIQSSDNNIKSSSDFIEKYLK